MPIPSYAEQSIADDGRYCRRAPPRSDVPGILRQHLRAEHASQVGNEALTLHEAVPGHHLQIALAQELDGVPILARGRDRLLEVAGPIRKAWDPLQGFYTDPIPSLANSPATMCAHPASVGHRHPLMGWTREQAIDFFRANLKDRARHHRRGGPLHRLA